MYDVIVVGAGPAGTRTAFRLAKLGYHVIVLEKRPGVG
ncbi:MAG TPA: FAD-dependent oxidoreductase, partial [Dehalococcoidales bacterium]